MTWTRPRLIAGTNLKECDVMQKQTEADHYDVIVVGAGPTGSALAGDLGRRGHRVLLVEKTDGIVHDARLHSVSIRTMEFARKWGIEDALRNCGWPQEHPQDVVWATSLADDEIARIPWPAISQMVPPTESPTFAQRCPQKWFNAILLRFAQAQPSVTVRLLSEVTAVRDDSDRVEVSTTQKDGATRHYTARFLVACDGSRSGIRRDLGIDVKKSDVWGQSAEVIIRSSELRDFPLAQTMGRLSLVEPAGMAVSLLPFDGRDQFRVIVIVSDKEVTESDMTQWIYKIAGREVNFEFMSPILPWYNRETLAATFRAGNIFLAGDAVHTMPTTGGLGMNTGIQDSVDLGWKLSAVLNGWAGETLLESYDYERRLAVQQTASLASAIYKDKVALRAQQAEFWQQIGKGGVDADLARKAMGQSLIATFGREFNNISASLGYRYEGSAVCVSEAGEPPAVDFDQYVPCARPGHRAPHSWLPDGRSTLDLFDMGFTLIVLDESAPGRTELVGLAADRMIPLEEYVADPSVIDELRGLYETALTLVRPDGHVAWRGNEIADPELLLDVITGSHVEVHHAVQTTLS